MNGAIYKYRLLSAKVRLSWLEKSYNKMEVRLHNINININHVYASKVNLGS
jgi:hypothetical protein